MIARLADSTLAEARAVPPAYDRRAMRCGIVHLGLGAFSRPDLAVYADDLLALGHDGLGILGVSLRNDDVPHALGPQDGLYTLVVIDGSVGLSGMPPRIIGSVREALHAPSQAERVRTALASDTTSIISVTVTEKGYCIDPATGRLDRDHPDISHDVAEPDVPHSAIGHLLLAARDRRGNGAGAVTVLSLDNLLENGATLRRAVRDLAALGDASLVTWIDEHMAFPNSMVDRMVPSTDDALRVQVGTAVGLDDAWPVRAEPYSQWVVERTWARAMPPLHEVGVQVVDDVVPWESLKLRVLNALHTAAAHYGLFHGLDTIDLVAADPGGRALLDRVAAEIVEVLEGPPGVDVNAYVATTFERFANTGLGHRCAQVATDTSQKLPPRLQATIRARLTHDLPIDAIAEVLALWAWSTLGVDHAGQPRVVADPLASEYARIARDCTIGERVDARRLAEALLGIEGIFGDLAGNSALADPVTERLAESPQHGQAQLDRPQHRVMRISFSADPDRDLSRRCLAQARQVVR